MLGFNRLNNTLIVASGCCRKHFYLSAPTPPRIIARPSLTSPPPFLPVTASTCLSRTGVLMWQSLVELLRCRGRRRTKVKMLVSPWGAGSKVNQACSVCAGKARPHTPRHDDARLIGSRTDEPGINVNANGLSLPGRLQGQRPDRESDRESTSAALVVAYACTSDFSLILVSIFARFYFFIQTQFNICC